MRFKKIGEDQHGPIVNVITDKGFCIGTIAKWHGLFVATDWKGDEIGIPASTRNFVGKRLEEHFEFERQQNSAA